MTPTRRTIAAVLVSRTRTVRFSIPTISAAPVGVLITDEPLASKFFNVNSSSSHLAGFSARTASNVLQERRATSSAKFSPEGKPKGPRRRRVA